MFCSNIRESTGVLRVLPVGAKFDFVGCSWVWRLSTNGKIGVEHVTENLPSNLGIHISVVSFQSVHQIIREHIGLSSTSTSPTVEKSNL